MDTPVEAVAPTLESTAPLTIWLTDRSRFKTGISRCPRERYLKYHFGPSGYGITRSSQSLPLATGQYLAAGFETLLKIVQATGRLPTVQEVRETIAIVQGEYAALVTERGFHGVLAGPATDETIREQLTLIAGLIWIVQLKFLPWFHARYTVVECEQERLHFLRCTCGAAALDTAEHVRRGCQGVALMVRCDLLAQSRSSGSLAYFEVKTTGWESSAWAEQWETDYQLALGTLDMPARYGAEVTELYIVGLNKGKRAKDKYNDTDPDARKKQQTALCYGYCQPGNPPLAVEDWLPAYEWVDDTTGETKRAPRAYRRRGIWEIAQGDWPVWRAYQQQDPEMSAEELWVRMLPTSILDRVGFVLGPMNRQDAQLASVRTAMAAEEVRWQGKLWALYELLHEKGEPFGSETTQRVLDVEIPQAWTCRPYGTEHQCEFVPVCHRHAGWQDPLATGKYRLRRPHHQPEIDQAVARGLLIDETVAEEEVE